MHTTLFCKTYLGKQREELCSTFGFIQGGAKKKDSHRRKDGEFRRKRKAEQKVEKKVNVLKMYNNFGRTLTLTINMIEF